MKVRATRTGYDGLKRRKEGEVFDLKVLPKDKRPKDWKLPSWVEAATADVSEDDVSTAERAEHARLKKEAGSPAEPAKAK
ncbi:MAG TPA: hypothetical protein VNI78_02245 [Vicinamibacterales bacterium]|nr:hypothetical protein [Vicinamibacterales bacterium]